MRVGLLGGTFNPIHRCHLEIAARTRDRTGLDRVVFIPTGDPPHKPPASLAPAPHRLEMVRLAVAGQAGFEVSDIETRRATKSYSIETVEQLQDRYGTGTDLFFIAGLDAFLDIPSWRRVDELLRLCHFVVIARPGTTFLSLRQLAFLPVIEEPLLKALDAGQAGRLDIELTDRTVLTLLSLPPCTASASEIRRRIAAHQPVSGLLPPPVESYIIRHGLYKEDRNRSRL